MLQSKLQGTWIGSESIPSALKQDTIGGGSPLQLDTKIRDLGRSKAARSIPASPASLSGKPSVPVAGTTPKYSDRIALIRGAITTLRVDAIMNAANKSLLGGGGVDGAIHRAAGRELGGCETGCSKIADAYNLPCRKVIHTVGPAYDDVHPERSEAGMRGCFHSSLELAVERGLKTIAFRALRSLLRLE
ncbi:macro domain-containing protein [Apiospora saccharicola]